MTESEWLQLADPVVVLYYLPARPGARKLRLFACACCRRIWDLITDERGRHAVEVAERHADGLVGEAELSAAHVGSSRYSIFSPSWVGTWAAHPNARQAAFAARFAADVRSSAEVPPGKSHLPDWLATRNAAWAAERKEQAALLREIIGNPFRPVTVDPAWGRWQGGAVRKLARAIYDERRFGDLPILADALEDAGCGDEEILNHCRQAGVHVRGCWAVDLARGNQEAP